MEAFLKSLPRPIFGIGRLGLNQWNREFYSINMLNSGLICTRHFGSFKNKPRIPLRHKASVRTYEHSRKYFLKHSFITKCKLPPSIAICYSKSSPPSCLSSLKSYPLIEKYFLSSVPRHYESVNLLHSVLYQKSVKKPSFSRICREKYSQSLEHPESLKSSAPFSKYLKHLKYPLKRRLSLPELCKQYSSSCPTSCSSCPHSLLQCSQDASKSIQEAFKRLSKSQRNKTRKTCVLCYPIFLHRVHWRGFHSSLFSLAKSDSNKSSACKKIDEICKSTEEKTNKCSQPCKKKSDVCHQEKVKCDKKTKRNKEKITAMQNPNTDKIDAACKKTCLPIGKCELPRTVPPPKMEYEKVTCPPPKFVKPKPCPPMEHLIKDDISHIATKINARKKQICAPPPLPKPPYAPIVLCPCPPPPKVHPGPCPCYKMKEISKRPLMQPCPLKKKYPCPTVVHYCILQKKPCKLKRETSCEHRKKKEAPES